VPGQYWGGLCGNIGTSRTSCLTATRDEPPFLMGDLDSDSQKAHKDPGSLGWILNPRAYFISALLAGGLKD
jgi:hypothetical protein